LGIQVVQEKDEMAFDFDILDPTKLIPEEIVPVKIIGKMTLNRNPDNFFAETEQVAFHVGNIVPGIDFTNDPLMQGRLFSYTDTQLIRLGGPNFHEIPINRSVVPVHNNQRDGHMRMQVNAGQASYHPNTLGGGCPFQAKMSEGGFVSYNEKIDAQKIRGRSKSFFDHFSQAKLFFASQSEAGKRHIIMALQFELSKVQGLPIRERMVGILSQIDEGLAARVAEKIGVEREKTKAQLNYSVPADGNARDFQPMSAIKTESSPALDMDNLRKDALSTRKVAILASDGADDKYLTSLIADLKKENITCEIISTQLGDVKTSGGKKLPALKTLFNSSSVFYDAVYVPGGTHIKFLSAKTDAVNFLNEAYKHGKPIGFDAGADPLISQTSFAATAGNAKENANANAGVVLNSGRKNFNEAFIEAMRMGRFWEREMQMQFKR
jgi:catalase